MSTAMQSDAFDVIPFEDIKGDWKKLGSGSFGNVYKGSYLGIDVAIKEVLPSNEYDVAKYFEREWRLMKEARHPNVVLYLGLSRAPPPDGRIFIISEFIENGNLRSYIYDKTKPFPWTLRLSFAIDIARALAYLHARRCIHRDLKGENLLVTANGRLKITDFGFARIAARNEEESKRLTFCGTDSYMSPEILMGDEFDLPTDIFSLGVIFTEIASRKLADDRHFKRTAPTFAIDVDEVRSSASPGCPTALVDLCIDCMSVDPAARPTTRQILERLRVIELEVLERPSEANEASVGTVKFFTGSKRPTPAPRIPSFGMGVGSNIRASSITGRPTGGFSSDEDSDDEELHEALEGLNAVRLGSDLTSTPASEGSNAPLLDDTASSSYSDYSTTVIRGHPHQNGSSAAPPALSSILTVRQPPSPHAAAAAPSEAPPSSSSIMTIQSYQTARSTIPSIAGATEGGSTIRMSPSTLVHRFTLIKPGGKRPGGSSSPPTRGKDGSDREVGWSPFDFFFSSGLLAAKCDLCTKRIGWKPCLECDDCGLRAHIKCGELAPRDCGMRPIRRPATHPEPPIPLLPKVKQGNKAPK
ncbi:kinase-like protein [Punctularia strigosozonata HHB-11173 SS5]|uniref:kinase-like protein n=1 Tax=Punctularia strigosozonata (strain HHB-11173) TaxID=741275 RepID=UPI0004417D2C|nr:kinase-like protein [Punctularia strigosozonata HHB-11173 SS5]EIN05846.1 kinase-like protein [Punctularia strigosozonata HHB-11173 SS5]